MQFAVIGAAAMSTHGFPRQTLDFDFLTTDPAVLKESFWAAFSQTAEVRQGDMEDPLRGVVRFHDPEVDIVVGRNEWQAEAVQRAEDLAIGGSTFPVVTVADLILLKLDAGGFRDASDIKTMLSGVTAADIQHVEALLPRLDASARQLWMTIREGIR